MKYRVRKVETDKSVLYYPEERWFRVLWWEFWSPILTDYDTPKICMSYAHAVEAIEQRKRLGELEEACKNFEKKETIIPYE